MWLESSGAIDKKEIEYLWEDDLIALGPSDPDAFLDKLCDLVEDCMIWASTYLKIVSCLLCSDAASFSVSPTGVNVIRTCEQAPLGIQICTSSRKV